MKGFLFDCTASFGNLHRRTYHIAVFTPKINAESAKYMPFPVQYYRRFLYSKFSSKNRWFVPNCCTNQTSYKHWGFEVKIGRNFGKSGLSQNVIETSFLRVRIVPKMYPKPLLQISKLRHCRQRKKAKKESHFYFDLTELLFDVIISMLNMSMMIIVVL